MRKLYLDSADIDEIARVSHTDAISGVTTNPSLMAKTDKGDYFERIQTIAKVLSQGCHTKHERKKHLSVEVITTDRSEMFHQALKLWKSLESFKPWLDVHIKVPVTLDNLSLITDLERKHDVRVNATACMIPSQAILAQDAGASVVSFFYNRMKDGGDSTPWKTIREFADRRPPYKYDPFHSRADIICGSIRKPEDVNKCWFGGAEIVTVSMKIIELLMKHPQTDLAIENFQRDIDKWLG